jgi:hypothetical protein
MTDDLCPICLDPLLNINNDVKTTYNLPECNHSYHTECIMHWFRGGNRKCPCCSDAGTSLVEQCVDDDAGCVWYETLMTKFKHVKQISKDKNTPEFIIAKLEKLKKLESKNDDIRIELKSLNNSNGVFKEIQKNKLKLEKKISYNTRVLFQMKKEIVLLYPIKPIIVVTRKVINL